MNFYTNPPRDNGLTFVMPTMTQQHHKDDCDINTIMAKYRKTGELPALMQNFGFADVSDSLTFQEAMDFTIMAREAFGELPSKLRERFRNDPGELLSFIDDPENYDEAVRLGILQPQSVGDTPKGVPVASASSSLDVTGTTDSGPTV